MHSDDASLVHLTTCSDNSEASLLKAFLEANGIATVLQGENHRAMLGVLGGYIELRVLVARRDEQAARELLREMKSEESDAATDPLPGAESAQTEEPGDGGGRRARRRRLLGLTVLLAAFVIPLLFSALAALVRILF